MYKSKIKSEYYYPHINVRSFNKQAVRRLTRKLKIIPTTKNFKKPEYLLDNNW